MLLDATNGRWRFMSNNGRKDFIQECLLKSNGDAKSHVSIGLFPIVDKLVDAGYELYADDEGMIKMPPLAMNLMINPLCDPSTTIYYASMGGPFGSMVLHRPNGPIDVKFLRELCSATDVFESEGEPEYTNWTEVLDEAIADWQKGSVTTTTPPKKKPVVTAT